MVGGILAAHGTQKLFGWFGGHGIEGTGGFLESMGFRRGHAWLVGATELGGGLGVAFGLLTALSAAAVVGVMLTAIAVAHWQNGFFSTNGGYEFPLSLAVAALAIAFGGPGAWSLDHLFGWSMTGTAWGFFALVLAALASAVVMGTRGARMPRGVHRPKTA